MTVWMQAAHVFVIRRPCIHFRLSRRTPHVVANGRQRTKGECDEASFHSTIVGSLLGTSNTTSYIESAAGVAAGGRSGVGV